MQRHVFLVFLWVCKGHVYNTLSRCSNKPKLRESRNVHLKMVKNSRCKSEVFIVTKHVDHLSSNSILTMLEDFQNLFNVLLSEFAANMKAVNLGVQLSADDDSCDRLPVTFALIDPLKQIVISHFDIENNQKLH